MRYKKTNPQKMLVAAALILVAALSASAQKKQSDGSTSERDVTILVTAHPHDGRTRANAQKLQADDFSVREEKRPQQIITVKAPHEVPPVVAILIQDDLVPRVNNELEGIKDFIRGLPKDSRMMIGYVTAGSLQVAQDFTTDRDSAVKSLRIVRGVQSAAPFNPYVEVVEALRRFDSQPVGRRIILLVSDGLDVSRGFRSASPTLSIDLDRAIREAQRRGVAVFSFYSPSVGLTGANRLAVNYGQGSLNRLADETGGEAFFSGTDFVSFDPYFKEFNSLLRLQWLITYRSSNIGSGFRRIEVTTESDVHLHYPEGYSVK